MIRKLVSLVILAFLSFPAIGSEDIRYSIRYHKEGAVVSQKRFKAVTNTKIRDSEGGEWLFSVNKQKVAQDAFATDYTFIWELKEGIAADVSFSIDFVFSNWTEQNYVFVPSIVYDGNRFEFKEMGYPPFWYDENEWRLDMPTTMRPQPSLGVRDKQGNSRIELASGNAATPLMSFYSERDKKAWMVQTNQGNSLGDYGLTIAEKKKEAVFSIQSPVTRSGNKADIPATVKAGEKVVVKCRVYEFEADKLSSMLAKFMQVRKEFNESKPNEVLPFGEIWHLLNGLYQSQRWDDRINMYWLGDVKEDSNNAPWCFVWQLGWCGGGQATLPILTQGSALEKDRAIRNLDAIYEKTQAKSGFFNAYGNGKEFCAFGWFNRLDKPVTLVRSQGDWLYMSQRQISLLQSRGNKIKQSWLDGTKRLADAFVRNWDKFGQFGHFVDVETGDVKIGNSTSGGIVPAGLVLASKIYSNPRYLEVASEAARAYYKDYVCKGYTTGGPGEIMSAPDHESAFGLFESYMVLYEHTQSKEWLKYASELLPVCASWVVSYDFQFPENSILGKIGAHSCGSLYASVANKHAAPGICNWSGEGLLKYFRATGDMLALELLVDIAHNMPQYICRKDCQIGNMPLGGVCERVNMSDWEGKNNIGGNIFASCSWAEVAAMQTVTQLPSIYVQPDTKALAVFDHVQVKQVISNGKLTALEVFNPTVYYTKAKILIEDSSKAKHKPYAMDCAKLEEISLNPGESKKVMIGE